MRGYVRDIRDASTAKPLDEPAASIPVVLQGLGRAPGGLSVEEKGGESRVEWRPHRLWSQRKVLQHIVVALRSLEPQPVVVLGPKGYYILWRAGDAIRTRDNLLGRQSIGCEAATTLYRYAIGTTPGGTEVVNWTRTGAWGTRTEAISRCRPPPPGSDALALDSRLHQP